MPKQYKNYAATEAQLPNSFLERKFQEPHSSSSHYRNEIQRDRDRIIHSRSFRRLEYKTQVFVNYLGDNFRTRLTHSIEVSQISRTVSRALKLNEDLSETLALAHDLGHPPFGHAGERALHLLLKQQGGFDHNKQTLRVVEKLEQRYPQFHGLNLTYITRLGLRKHEQLPDGLGHTLEANIVDLCDEIAYNNHDIEDGVESGLLSLQDLQESSLWQKIWHKTVQEHLHTEQKIQVRYTVRNLINFMVEELIKNSLSNLKNYNIQILEDVFSFHKKNISLIGYTRETEKEIKNLKKLLYKKLYRHRDIAVMNRKAARIVERLYWFFLRHYQQLPKEYVERVGSEGKERVVADFIAGMTDRYALTWNEKVDHPHQGVFDF